MRRFFRLRDDRSGAPRWHLGEIADAAGEWVKLANATPFRGTLPLRGAVTHAGPVLAFTLTSFNVPVVSEALGEVVRATVGADAECLPIELPGQAAMVLNVVRVVRCIDEAGSELDREPGDEGRPGPYRRVYTLAVDDNAIPADAHLFRVEGWKVALVVSDALKSAMEHVGCEGARFHELG